MTVASVTGPHHSPLRYPGGKAKLAPLIKRLFESNRLLDGHYAEPYAGGAGVALSLLFDDYVRRIHLNDLDRSVYAFWHATLTQTEELTRRVRDTRVTGTEWLRQREVQRRKTQADLLELAFSTFFLNRTNRSGIIGSGGMIGGSQQRGCWKLDARYNTTELIRRIERIATYRDRISLTNLDAVDCVAALATSLPDNSLTYLDPPYFVQGQQRLYASYYREDDHKVVCETMGVYPKPWVVSYDYAPEILALYASQRCLVYDLHYTAAVRKKGAEIMFFSDDLQLPALTGISKGKRSAPAKQRA